MFNKIIEKIKRNRLREYNCIPLGFDRFEEHLPGIEKGIYQLITASSGVGKSRFVRSKFLFTPYNWVKANPEQGLSYKGFYFSLEESEEAFTLSLICTLLKEKHNISISPKQLYSISKSNRVVDETIEQLIELLQDEIEEFYKYVTVISHIRNPFGIYKEVRSYAIKNGKFYYQGNQVDITKPDSHWDNYIPNNPDEHVVVATDHIGLLGTEKGGTVFDSIKKYSSEYCLTMRNSFGYTIANVQQQVADKEKQEFTMKGNSIESKLEPSLDGLNVYKNTAQDCDEAFGLFAPDRYEIKTYRGYNIERLQDNFRQISKLKCRNGSSNIRAGLLFKGATGHWYELPKAVDMTEQDYINAIR